ncbi:YybH family protein [Massilia sp. TSP1-1-2]|uniref:YybH family protein n=1 Tax=unclassified Massilia TaxID=2609279 RepID=UPI003CEA7E57
MNTDEQAIRDLIARWIDATRAGDVDAVLALMAPDATFLMAGQMPMVGHEAFANSLRAVLADHAIESSSTVDEVAVSGNMAYCRTSLTVTVTSKHGQLPLQRTGHTLTILRKGDDGKWLLTRDANMLAAQG